jgi:hypothetical protein
MKTRVEEWWIGERPEGTLAEFIRRTNLPVRTVIPVAWRTAEGLSVVVQALVIFEVVNLDYTDVKSW